MVEHHVIGPLSFEAYWTLKGFVVTELKQALSCVVQKSSPAETVTTANLKIISVRFGRLLCFPLGTLPILHSSTNNRSCCSSRHIVPCPTSRRREKQRSDGGRDTCKFSPSQLCLPAGPSIWHLTTIAVNGPLECHWHSFCLAQFFSGMGFVPLQLCSMTV